MRNEIYHTLVCGKTGYGKTTIVKKITGNLHKGVRPVLVLTPFVKDEGWKYAAYVDDDPDRFIEVVENNTGCIIVVDEGGEMANRQEKATQTIATRGRHNGHQAFFIGQCASDISPVIRRNCQNLFLFKASEDDCDLLYKVFVDKLVYEAPRLEKGHCIAIIDGRESCIINAFDL